MEFNQDELAIIEDRIKLFSPSTTCRLLALLAQNLTVAARSTYETESSGVGDPHKLRMMNECQHFVVGILCRLLFKEEVDTVSFVESLHEFSTDPCVGGDFRWALGQALDHVG